MAPLKASLLPPTLGAINSLGNLNLAPPAVALRPRARPWGRSWGEAWGRCAQQGPGEAGGGSPQPRALASPVPRQPKPTKGRMRIHCLENVDKALQFLKEQKVHLENMGSHDIVDGNHRLTLGLVWTIILRFQVVQPGVTQRVLPTSALCCKRSRPVRAAGDTHAEGLRAQRAARGQAAVLIKQGPDQCGCVVKLPWQVPCGPACVLLTGRSYKLVPRH